MVLRPAARYHYSRHCLWLAGIVDDYKVTLQGVVMGKWELIMDDDEIGSQSSNRVYDVILLPMVEEVRAQVNKWAEEATNGLIQAVIPRGSIDKKMRLVLANTLYFKGIWKNELIKDLTKDSKFYLLEGSFVKIPRFKISFGFEASEVLKRGGLDLPFSCDAQLVGMVTSMLPNKNLKVREDVHKSFIKVNEEGTKVAAVTYVDCDVQDCMQEYIMNKKVPPTASNKRKRELARERDLVTYKRKKKTIDPSIVVPPNTVDSANEGVSELQHPTESAQGMNIPQGWEFETESTQVALGAQPLLLNVSPNLDVNIPIVGGYSKGEGDTSNNDVGPSDKSLLRSFRFNRARSIALGQLYFVDIITIIVHGKLPIRVHHHQSRWDLTKEPRVVQDFVKLKGLDKIGNIS
ncbi:hypothetical protein GIB67_029669 [Kingdonia uniflora]|uniref:Serpin domain-containing protein n=1 Tax=Kingdonia uniflora TaxID=39325 RepID=A0A7J7LLS5_9MAGN|nr:hypothetical protein GIB67_029669 [Kingdonia uniflora]